MTNFKCRDCGIRWSEGPTRDYKEGEVCRKCLQQGILDYQREVENPVKDLRLIDIRRRALFSMAEGVPIPVMEWVLPDTPLEEMRPGCICLLVDPPPPPGVWVRMVQPDGTKHERIQYAIHT